MGDSKISEVKTIKCVCVCVCVCVWSDVVYSRYVR